MTKAAAKVRLAAASDSAELLSLIEDHAHFDGSKATLAIEDLDRILSSDPRPIEILVAKRQNALIGCAALTYDFSLPRARRRAHLDCLFVVEEYRGQSTGPQLFDFATIVTCKSGADRIECQTPADL